MSEGRCTESAAGASCERLQDSYALDVGQPDVPGLAERTATSRAILAGPINGRLPRAWPDLVWPTQQGAAAPRM